MNRIYAVIVAAIQITVVGCMDNSAPEATAIINIVEQEDGQIRVESLGNSISGVKPDRWMLSRSKYHDLPDEEGVLQRHIQSERWRSEDFDELMIRVSGSVEPSRQLRIIVESAFAFSLEINGINADVREIDSSLQITSTTLMPPGRYEFKVKSRGLSIPQLQ